MKIRDQVRAVESRPHVRRRIHLHSVSDAYASRVAARARRIAIWKHGRAPSRAWAETRELEDIELGNQVSTLSAVIRLISVPSHITHAPRLGATTVPVPAGVLTVRVKAPDVAFQIQRL